MVEMRKNMDDINENVAKNIAMLRKANNLTQADLANKLNYSDKSISKWEREESVPDIAMLCKLAKLFNVNVDFLTESHTYNEIKKINNGSQLFLRNLLMVIMLCFATYLIATIIFIYPQINSNPDANKYWVSFVAAAPICALIVWRYGKKEKYWLCSLISISLFIWTLITTIYIFTTFIFNLDNLWMLFLVGLPIQGAICVYYFWKRTF